MDIISESSTTEVSQGLISYVIDKKVARPPGSDPTPHTYVSPYPPQPLGEKKSPQRLVDHCEELGNEKCDPTSDTSDSTVVLNPRLSQRYLIESLAPRDDVDLLRPWKRCLYFFSSVLVLSAFFSYLLYFAFRIYSTLAAQRASQTIYPAAWIFIAIEIASVIPVFLESWWSVFVLKSRGRPKLRLKGNTVPVVDVLITTCGEDEDTILNTVRAACSIDYPADRFRIFVLDDGRSPSLFRSVIALNRQYPNLYYRTREKIAGVPHHFKAGNLNFGLKETMTTNGEVGEFIAALDADMIPEPNWLRAILPHMLVDERCGLACPPQLFYNVPPNDPLYQALDFFAHISEPIKDALGVAWCTGSGYVVRRCALNTIGQIPVGSVAEDVLCSTLLLGQGWRTAYIHEGLQYGQVPGDFGSHIKQRTRWTIGTMQSAGRLHFSLWGSETRRLTFAQRISGFMYAFVTLFNFLRTISMFFLPGILMSGAKMVAYATSDQLRWLIRGCWLAFTLNRISELSLFLPAGYRTGQRGTRAIMWMAPYHAITMLRVFILPSWLGGQATSFKPTGSLKSELKERNPRERAPVSRRVKVILWNYLGGFHLTYILFVLAAVILSSVRCSNQPTMDSRLIYLLTHAFWPPVTWLVYVSATWTPIIYALKPPTVADNEDLLERDPITNVAYPKESSKYIRNKLSNGYFEFQYSLMTIYITTTSMICYMFTEVSYWHTGLAAVTPFVALSELILGFSGIRMLSGKELSGKEDVRSQATDPVTMKFYVVCEKRGLTVGTRMKTASDWLIALTGSRKLFPPTSVYLMTLRAGQLQSPHGFLRVALPRLQLFTKGNLMLDKESCNSVLAEDDSTPRIYERAYHSSINPQIYNWLRASTNFIMDVPWQFITISSLAGSFGIVRLAPQYSPSSYFVATFLLVFLGEIVAAVTWQAILWPRFISPLRHLPEPPGASFLNGHFATISKEPTGHPQRRWFKEVPNNGLIRYRALLNQERLLPTTQEAYKEVLSTRSYEFIKPSMTRNGLARLLGVGILLAEGEEHKRQRKSLDPAFETRHIRDLHPTFWALSAKLVRALTSWIETESKGTITSLSDAPVVEISTWTSRATLDIIGIAGMDKNFDAIANPDSELYATYQKVFQPTSGQQLVGLLSFFLPLWFVRSLPFAHNGTMAEAAATIRKICRELISEKQEKLKLTEKEVQEPRLQGSTDKDILSVAMKSGHFTTENLVDQLMTFLAAGHETTASSLTWACYSLCQYPEIQARLREDIRTHLPSVDDDSETITAALLSQCHYLHAVCHEVLRFWAIVPLTMREAAHNTTIQGQFVPKGTKIIICPNAVNTSVSMWGPDAEKFNPDRWMAPGQANRGGAESAYANLTFLAGPRSCIGKQFALAEFASLLAALVGKFEFEFEDPEYPSKMKIKGGITSRPKEGVSMRMRPVEGW